MKKTTANSTAAARCILGILTIGACGGSTPDVVADAAPSCRDDPRVQSYEPGMTATATDGFSVALLSAMPSPPERLGNTWSLEVRDAQGVPLAADSFQVDSFMPEHGHGASLTSGLVAGTMVGRYQTGLFDLWMPGIWEVKFLIEHPGGSSRAAFVFCIEE